MNLTRQQQKLYDLLFDGPGFVTWQEIAAVLWADRQVSDPRRSINVQLHNFRGMDIPVEHAGRNLGWRIRRDAK